jgi:hypothetical protein
MPAPRDGENRDDFMERCIPIVLDDGTAEDQEQAAAVCSSMWEDAQEDTEEEGKMKVVKTVPIQILKTDENGGRIVISTGDVDRDKDRVIPAGARIDDYMKNPVVQFAHNYAEPWATIGRTSRLEIGKEGIVAEFELRPPANETDPQNIVKLLWEGQWIRTASIGFIPMEFDENEHGGRDYNDWQLLEWSLVPVPANQNALRMAVKALGEDETPGYWVTTLANPSVAATFDQTLNWGIKAEDVQKRIDELKRGRVLSRANENKLKKARDILDEVLAQVAEIDEDEKSAPEPEQKDLSEHHDSGDDEPSTDEPADASPTDDVEPEADADAEIVELVEQFLNEVEQTLTEANNNE